MIKYYPRRPVKSFQDLEIYQKLLANGVMVVKAVNDCQTTPLLEELIKNPLIKYVVDLPRLIAKAHSIRFDDFKGSQETLELAMLNCNLAVVHLELFRDLVRPGAGVAPVLDSQSHSEIIKSYLTVRYKILHLQKTWQKFKEGV
ncbi:hypothetical protein L6255_01195 [Candidatus Parcubacteria bacterium]|nr:hypothetical protein [Patescibacteria group bacterium]MCG2689034.1 hypothetical protein [Candidatus Parcubacteria bacterium]